MGTLGAREFGNISRTNPMSPGLCPSRYLQPVDKPLLFPGSWGIMFPGFPGGNHEGPGTAEMLVCYLGIGGSRWALPWDLSSVPLRLGVSSSETSRCSPALRHVTRGNVTRGHPSLWHVTRHPSRGDLSLSDASRERG
jgi:hypothetical protein